MKVYVAGHSRWECLHVASTLILAGHSIESTWLAEPFDATANYTEQEREEIALQDLRDIGRADAIALVAGPEKYAGGKFVEVGYGLALRKYIVVIGRRENMLMWHPLIKCVDTPEEAAQLLTEKDAVA